MNSTARVAPVSLAVVTTIVLSGCASSLSGVGSTENYACKAPIGAQCTSVSGVYANANPLAARAVHEAPLPPQSLLASMAGAAPARQAKPASPTGTSSSEPSVRTDIPSLMPKCSPRMMAPTEPSSRLKQMPRV